jgi:hypothetical protein
MSTLELLGHRNLRIVAAEASEERRPPHLFVHGIRTLFLVTILVISFVYQIRLGNFLNTEMWLPVYAVLGANFVLNSVYLFYFDRLSQHVFWNAVLFALDAAAMKIRRAIEQQIPLGTPQPDYTSNSLLYTNTFCLAPFRAL